MKPNTQIASRKVLIVDDSAHIRILLKRLVKNAGFQSIELAENGLVGLQKVQASPPDIMFLDGVMPEMDGLTLLREAKTIRPDIIVVMTTSLSSKEKVLRFKEAGADFYLLKPFDDEKFNEMVEKVIARLQLRESE